jgi:hypothetical protein
MMKVALPSAATPHSGGHDCCKPTTCDEHRSRPVDSRCTVRVDPATLYVSHHAALDITHLALIAIVPSVVQIDRPSHSLALGTVADEIPPESVNPKHGCAPRAPPAFSV